MALSDVLNNLAGARDALVSAINGKGGSVATTATLRQCAEAVTALPEGGGSSGNAPVFDGLIFYLSFDRWMTDSVSDLKIPFSDIETEPGKNDLCGYFDGRNSWAAIPKEKISISGRSEWSVGFWFKPEQLTQTVINPVYAEWNESDYGSARFSVQLTNDLKVFSQVNFTDGQEAVDLLRAESVEALSIGTWYFVFVSVNLTAKQMVLYVNGMVVATSTNEACPESAPSPLPYNDPQLMNWFTGETNPSSGGEPLYETAGSLDEFAFWGRALSADEVATLYNSGNGLFYRTEESVVTVEKSSSLLRGVSFYSSLTDVETSETADKMNMIGTVSVTNVGGVTSGNFNGSSYLTSETYKKLPQFSVCAWLNCASSLPANGIFIASNDIHFRLELVNNVFYGTTYSYKSSHGDPEGRVSHEIDASKWTLLIFTFDSSTYRLFVDKQNVASVNKTKEDYIPYFDSICLGGISDSGYARFNGNISDAIIYNRALTDEEIAELYALGPGGFSSVWNGETSGGGSSGGGATSADLVDLIERDIASIEIPEGTTEIGYGAFSQCSSLNSVSIPEGVTKISQYAFLECTSLTSVVIPRSVTTIENSAFLSCFALDSLIILPGVTSIGSSAFSICTSLTSVVIPNSVTEIGASAFAGCRLLASVTIPDSVLSIGNLAFSDCDSLTDIYCGFAENAVPGAPWGAPETATIHYNA